MTFFTPFLHFNINPAFAAGNYFGALLNQSLFNSANNTGNSAYSYNNCRCQYPQWGFSSYPQFNYPSYKFGGYSQNPFNDGASGSTIWANAGNFGMWNSDNQGSGWNYNTSWNSDNQGSGWNYNTSWNSDNQGSGWSYNTSWNSDNQGSSWNYNTSWNNGNGWNIWNNWNGIQSNLSGKNNYGTLKDYNSEKGNKLANDIENHAVGFTGYCAHYVSDALNRTGLDDSMGRGHGYQMAGLLRRNKNFKEISVSGDNWKNLPAGAILCFNRGSQGYSKEYGHVEVSLGDGRACSDGTTNNIKKPDAIFIPV